MLAKETDVPVARIAAAHVGVDEEQGAAMPEELFSGLPAFFFIF